MNRKEHLLTIAAEECNEVAQRISKALRFSLEEVQPGQNMTNAERILLEYNDLICALLMLHEEGHLPAVSPTKDPICNMAWVMAKKDKIEKFLEHSKANGTLTENGLTPTEPEKPEPILTLCKEMAKTSTNIKISDDGRTTRIIGSNGITDPPNETKKV